MSKSKKIIINLSGGLGNQLFQYSFARALAIKYDADLKLDTFSGFFRDYQYKRSFELGKLPICYKKANFLEIFPIYLFKLRNRLFGIKHQLFQKFWFGDFIYEYEQKYLEEIQEIKLNSIVYIIGYWQSPIYFNSIKDILLKELIPPRPYSKYTYELGIKIRNSNSVAIGVRFYEESKTPELHSSNQKLKDVSDIYDALKKNELLATNCDLYIFSTKKSLILEFGLDSDDFFYVTSDNGFSDPIDTLWLLSNAKSHLFTNSTFYWWGAWLSAGHTIDNKRKIISANNFINPQSICFEWDTF